MHLSQAKIKEILDYNSLTGDFIWKVKPSRRTNIGSIAGGKNSLGYRYIRWENVAYPAHKLAWMEVYGEWPDMLDHIDGDPSNNSIYNLRPTTYSQNGANRKINKTSKTGFKGVTINRHGKFSAMIGFNGETIYLGSYETAEEAHQIYCIKAAELFGAYHREGTV